jgi:pyridoxine kinase
VLSGYIGDAGIGAAIVDAVERVKHANPAALYCCDPVIGDSGPGIYVRDGIPQFLSALLVPRADIVTPNHFELEHLTGRRCATLGDALAAVAELHGRGPRIVVVTSLAVAETPADAIDLLASDGTESLRVRTPRLPLAASGAGDLFTAMLLARLLGHRPLGEALALAAASVYGILEKTSAASAREMLLVEAQDECVAPSHRFDVERIA